jgi:hypothetical protein
MVLVCLFQGAGTGVGTLCHFSTVSFRHVEQKTFQLKRIFYIQLDFNKTYGSLTLQFNFRLFNAHMSTAILSHHFS